MKARVRGVLWSWGLVMSARANTSMQMINSAATYKCPFTSVTTREATFSRLSSPTNRELKLPRASDCEATFPSFADFEELLPSFADCEVAFSRLGIFSDKNPGPIFMCAAPLTRNQILDLFEFLLRIVENPVRRDQIKIHKTAV